MIHPTESWSSEQWTREQWHAWYPAKALQKGDSDGVTPLDGRPTELVYAEKPNWVVQEERRPNQQSYAWETTKAPLICERAAWQEGPQKELCDLVQMLSTKVDRLSSEIALLREQQNEWIKERSVTLADAVSASAGISTRCAHGAPELFTERYEKEAASEIASYMCFAVRGDTMATESLFDKFKSIRDSMNYPMADQAFKKMVDWPSGEVGFEFHNGGGNEKYYRLGCSACRKATKRIYTKGKGIDNMQSKHFFCSLFNFGAGAYLGIP